MLSTSTATDVRTTNQEVTSIGPSEALARISELRKDQRVVVDFDETFFMRNSSQEFIRMVRPYVFGAIVYKVIELLRPWAWFAKGESRMLTRDWFHVWAVTIFFPWTWLVWRKHAPKMAEIWTNQPLAEVLRKRDPYTNVLCSQGFGPIIRPVLKHMGVNFGRVDACRMFRGYSDRRLNKVNRVRGMIGELDLQDCAVVTDSEEDRELLDYVEVPLLLKWPASPVLSVSSHYMPFYYMYKVKHKGFAPILRDILFVDLLLLFLAFSWISPLPLVHAVGMSFFFISFLLIYEIGYMENDEVAFELETDPVLGNNFEEKRDYISYVEPWFWATCFAFFGAGIFKAVDRLSELGIKAFSVISSMPTVREVFSEAFFTNSQYLLVGIWLVVLVSQRIVFRLYNYADKMTRTWINPFLQSYKSIIFMLISPINLIGAIALFSQVVSRSFGYFLYRWGRKTWPGSEVYLVRFILFPVILILISHATQSELSEVFTFQALVIALWISSRAIKPLFMVFRNIKHVSKDEWKKLEE
ncbi:MAG: HAD family hydrolase [Verrucomicrobia bacterium]|nr:HAD family hydrolase [Verrucomicrobiota bacterium]